MTQSHHDNLSTQIAQIANLKAQVETMRLSLAQTFGEGLSIIQDIPANQQFIGLLQTELEKATEALKHYHQWLESKLRSQNIQDYQSLIDYNEKLKRTIEVALLGQQSSCHQRMAAATELTYHTQTAYKVSQFVSLVIKTAIVAVVCFLIGLAFGAVTTGGITSIPAAIIASMKGASAYWAANSAFLSVTPPIIATAVAANSAVKQTKDNAAHQTHILSKQIRQTTQPLAHARLLDKLTQLYQEKGVTADNRDEDQALQNNFKRLHNILNKATSLQNSPSLFASSASKVKAQKLYRTLEAALDQMSAGTIRADAENLLQISFELSDSSQQTLHDVLAIKRNPTLDKLRAMVKNTEYERLHTDSLSLVM